MSWNINFNHYTAGSVFSAVEKNKHLHGFAVAEEKLDYLKCKLEELQSEARWWGDKCRQEADHYDHMQNELNSNPNNFSDDHARAVSKKSLKKLYGYADALSGGANKLQDAISTVGKILSQVKNAHDEAKQSNSEVLDKIKQAIDLMDRYLRVNF